MTAAEAMNQLRNGQINGATFNASQSKFVVDQMMGSKNVNEFRDKMYNIKRDDAGNEISQDTASVWRNQDSAFMKNVHQPYRDNQAGYIKETEASWKRAKAPGSTGIGDMGTEAFKNILKGDTFKWADDARSKKKENDAKAREQARHSEEMQALKDIAQILKSQNNRH